MTRSTSDATTYTRDIRLRRGQVCIDTSGDGGFQRLAQVLIDVRCAGTEEARDVLDNCRKPSLGTFRQATSKQREA
jgi:hypothetical protein